MSFSYLKIQQELRKLQDVNYQKFNQKLLPNIDPKSIIGVSLPTLRKLAKRLAKEDIHAYLLQDRDDSFEEIMLQGLVIGAVDMDLKTRLELIENFIPKIHCWSICDSFCSSLKFTNKSPSEVWHFLLPYSQSNKEYEVRFAVVMFIFYYLNNDYIDSIFQILDKITLSDYYAKMAIAWAISATYVKYPQKTLYYLKHSNLDTFIYNKSLQKIIESKQVSKTEKDFLRTLKKPS